MSGAKSFDFESNGLAIAWLRDTARDMQLGRPVTINDEDLELVARLLHITAAEIGGRPEDHEWSPKAGEPSHIEQVKARITSKVREKEIRLAPPSNVVPFPIHRARRPVAAA
ncbi:hypothetical protein JHL21_03440 [Devosia sp. WQ 349]|uniref:hypothetical protein n=1 Tax=Devosia sp. WQ 349K1 TaxID=2800329 RepID=UPI0019058800|nr:hypothetical protein [Devosia sp. WQ 349K1]MBK1793545.1 hypothetical protein [Devosia sp. WQ 349K1]